MPRTNCFGKSVLPRLFAVSRSTRPLEHPNALKLWASSAKGSGESEKTVLHFECRVDARSYPTLVILYRPSLRRLASEKELQTKNMQ